MFQKQVFLEQSTWLIEIVEDEFCELSRFK
ncbi:MAG: hypothetical protein RL494_171 [Bacteroidota bacterium]